MLKSKRSGERFFEQSFSNRKKTRGLASSNEFETIEQTYPVRILQNGWFALSKIHAAIRRLYVQTGPKRRILFYSIAQRIQKNDKPSMARQIICQCFRLGPATRIFTKLLKVPLPFLRVIIYKRIIRIIKKDDMLLQGKRFPEVLIAKDTDIFLLEHLGFVINLEKSVKILTQKI